ncbi:MAG TPA: hypothetical protein VGN80_04395 [Devosiaceae bacterium]|jgi:hypothetical protein|nr:hypothetical protein [Devosiaceae bacterium]
MVSAIGAPVMTGGSGCEPPVAAAPTNRAVAAGGSPGAGRVLCLVLALRALQSPEPDVRPKV